MFNRAFLSLQKEETETNILARNNLKRTVATTKLSKKKKNDFLI